jgi:hypothetical protein
VEGDGGAQVGAAGAGAVALAQHGHPGRPAQLLDVPLRLPEGRRRTGRGRRLEADARVPGVQGLRHELSPAPRMGQLLGTNCNEQPVARRGLDVDLPATQGVAQGSSLESVGVHHTFPELEPASHPGARAGQPLVVAVVQEEHVPVPRGP